MARAARGESRPYKRKQDGRWVVVVRDPDGRRRYLYGWSPEAVVAKRDAAMERVRAGLSAKPVRATVGRVLDDWLEERKGKVRPGSWITYEAHVRLHLASLRSIPLVSLTPADVRRVVREREAAGCSPATVGQTLVVLRMALKQAVGDGLVMRNVATLVKRPPAVGADLAILSRMEARRLIVAARDDAELGALWTLLVSVGCRLGEALALRWVDVDLRTGVVSISRALRPIDRRVRTAGAPRLQFVEPKTDDSRRTWVLPRTAVSALRRHRAQTAQRPASVDGLIFTTLRGTRLDPRNVSRRWVAFRDATGLTPIRLHDLRHTAASLALAQGLSIDDVKRMLGHRKIAQTSDTYGHLVRERAVEIAEAMHRALGGA